MKRFIAVITAFILCLGICSCTKKDETKNTTTESNSSNTETSTDAGTTKADESTLPSKTLELNVEIIENDKAQGLTTLELSSSEYAAYVLVKPNQTINNFVVYDVVCDIDDNGEIIINEETAVSESADVSESGIVIHTELPETLPFRMISFTTADGESYSYFITLSGRDNTCILQPIEK